jgi:glycosyltransferase involved in cell wall biosynthesis
LRVLALTKIFPNRNNPNAMPYVPRQCAALAEQCDLQIWATVPWFPGLSMLRNSLSNIPDSDKLFGLEVKHPRFLYLPRLAMLSGASYALSIAERLWRSRKQFDVILATFAYPDGVAATALGQLLGIPTVIQVIGSDVDVASQLPTLKPQVQWSFRHAAGVIAVSSALAEKCIQLGARRGSTTAIVTGVDRRTFAPRSREAARLDLGLSINCKLILYVGRLSQEKGVMDALEAFERMPNRSDVRLAFVGDGPLLQRLRERALGRSDIIVTGSLDGAKVGDWLAACDLLTLPSYHEGTPNAVLEAFSSGRPIVATHVGGIPDICTSPVYGELVTPGAVSELTSAYERVLSTPYMPDQIAACPALCSWEENARRVLSFLQTARTACHSGLAR